MSIRTSATPPLRGRNAVDASEYAVPTQTKSPPWRSWMITGRAVDTAVSSRADRKTERQSERMISQNLSPFLCSPGVCGRSSFGGTSAAETIASFGVSMLEGCWRGSEVFLQ